MKKAILILLVVLALSGCIERETTKTFLIVSMKTDKDISGSFILGFGNINETEYLLTFYKTWNGGYKRMRMKMRWVTIYEDEDEKPYVIKREDGWTNIRYAVHVPKGTIIKTFRVE